MEWIPYIILAVWLGPVIIHMIIDLWQTRGGRDPREVQYNLWADDPKDDK